MQQYIFHPHILEAIGILGFGLYVLNYALLSLRLVSGDALSYFVMNLAAASCVLAGLINSFNLPSALIQVFWISLSVIAIALRLTQAVKKSRDTKGTVSKSGDRKVRGRPSHDRHPVAIGRVSA